MALIDTTPQPIDHKPYVKDYLERILWADDNVEAPDRAKAGDYYQSLNNLYDKRNNGLYGAWDLLSKNRPELRAMIEIPAVDIAEQLPQLDTKYILELLENEEIGEAELLRALYQNRIVYDVFENKWYLWAGHRWIPDDNAVTLLLVSGQLVSQLYVAVAEIRKLAAGSHTPQEKRDYEAQEQFLLRRAKMLCRVSRTKNVLTFAQSLMPMNGQWDQKPMLLAVSNGVIDLKTGKLRPGNPLDYLRKFSPATYNGIDTQAKRFRRFICEIFGEDQSLADFIQRLFGYGITGQTTEHILPIFWGEQGRNGKDTLLGTITEVLGDTLSGTGTNDLLIQTRPTGAGGATPHLHRLMGQRLCFVSETQDGAFLNANQVKLITGGGKISARALYQRSNIEFEPTHLIMLITNHKPRVPNGGDAALWSRMLMIPFEIRFVDRPTKPNERQRDPHLKDALKFEKSGILAWLIEGCLKWQAEGLNPPAVVEAATEEYKLNEDPVALFLNECCILEDGYQMSVSDAHAEFEEWGGGMSQKRFSSALAKRFDKKRGPGGRYYFQGVGLKDSEQNESFLKHF